MRKGTQTGLAVVCAMGITMTTGCRVNRTTHGDGKDVRIETPFGGMSVKTDPKDIQPAIGLAVYPGAVPEKKDGDDHGAANVHMNFGNFHLGVQAASYTTPDSPDKVLGFYRQQMAVFGTVLECRGKQPVGTPSVTSEGLRCDGDQNSHMSYHDGNNLELRAGSPLHQHIVGLDPRGSGTRFALVLLDLPEGLNSGDGDSKQ